MVLLYVIFSLILALIILFVVARTRLFIIARLWSGGPEAQGEARIFFGLIRLRLYARIKDRSDGPELLLRIAKKSRRMPMKSQGKGVKLPIDMLKIEELTVGGCVGVKDDLFSAFMLSGALSAAAHTLCSVLTGALATVKIAPVYDRDAFWLYMEGIASVSNAQIIIASIRGDFKKRSKNNGASDRKHNQKQHG